MPKHLSGIGALALSVSLASLVLLPCIPILPGLASLLALILGLLVLPQQIGRQRWMVGAALFVAGGGIILALSQLAVVLATALGMGQQ